MYSRNGMFIVDAIQVLYTYLVAPFQLALRFLNSNENILISSLFLDILRIHV